MLSVSVIKGLIREGLAASFAAKTLHKLTVTAATIEAKISDPVAPDRVVAEFFAMSVGA